MVTEIWPEVWTRPGHANYGRVRDYLPFRSAGVHVGLNRIGDGNFELADTFAGFDDFLLTDPVTPANSKSSTVKWFSAADPTTPIAEWLPSEIFPGGSKDDPYTKVTGVGINGILGYARLEAYDWDGTDSFECQACDWIWGGDNVLGNPGFEDSQVTPTSYTLEIVASAGTYTITDGTDTTAALAFNAQAAAIETALQGFASITDLVVADSGSSPITRLITFVDPPFGVTLTLNPGGLTGTGTLTETQVGGLSPSPWTKAAALARGLPQNIGGYTTFEVSTAQNHTLGGQYSLAIDAGPSTATSNRNPGAQQRVGVKPGVTYQASIWVFPTSGTDRFRLLLAGIGEEVIARSSSSGVTLTPNVWNEITISDVVIPDGVSDLIFRIACTNPGPSNPSLFYIDDGGLFEGLVATTIGEMLRLLYEDATVDHVADGRLVWEDDANPGTPYLTLDFSDTLDSAGNAWADAEITTRLTMRQSYSQIMASFVNEYQYEYRIVADDVEAGTYLWQVYNPGGMDAAPDLAVQGGSSDVKRQLRRVAPGGTDQLVEALGRVTARARNANLLSALGRIEVSTLSREAPDLTAAASAAASAVAQSLQDISSVGYVFTGELQAEPMSSYTLGDTVTIVDPPDIAAASKRFVDLEISVDPNKVEWEAQYGALVITNADAAVADAVAGLLNKFEYPEVEIPEPVPAGGGAGGMLTIVVAASDASERAKEKADYQCTGLNDQTVVQQAIDELQGSPFGGVVQLTAGHFFFTFTSADSAMVQVFGGAVNQDGVSMRGMGPGNTVIEVTGTAPSGAACLDFTGNANNEIRDLSLEDSTNIGTNYSAIIVSRFGRVYNVAGFISETGTNQKFIELADDQAVVRDCNISFGGVGVHIGGNSCVIDSCVIAGPTRGIDITGVAGPTIIGNYIATFSDGPAILVSATSSYVRIVGNFAEPEGPFLAATGANTHLQESVIAGNVVVYVGTAGIGGANLFDLDNSYHVQLVIADNELNGGTGIRIGNTATISPSGQHNISGNTMTGSGPGIVLGRASRSLIANNILAADQGGIALEDSSQCKIADNHLSSIGFHQDNTYDGIATDADSDENHVHGNTVIGAASAPQPRYGINIAGDCNVVVGNHLGDLANYGTDALNNAGTNTQLTYPNDPTYGDNFTDCPPVP